VSDETRWACGDCGWTWPLYGYPPFTAECDSCGGMLCPEHTDTQAEWRRVLREQRDEARAERDEARRQVGVRDGMLRRICHDPAYWWLPSDGQWVPTDGMWFPNDDDPAIEPMTPDEVAVLAALDTEEDG
jgi:hypothetical protein